MSSAVLAYRIIPDEKEELNLICSSMSDVTRTIQEIHLILAFAQAVSYRNVLGLNSFILTISDT